MAQFDRIGKWIMVIKEGDTSLSSVKDVKVLNKEGNYVVVEIGSGKYHFVSAVK